MEEYEFIILYILADDKVKDQIRQVLKENQQCSDHEGSPAYNDCKISMLL